MMILSESYKVVARVYKPWFKSARLVYDVVKQYKEWYDPSYGHGGGDYEDRERVVATLKCNQSASIMVNNLNHYK